MRLNHVDNQVDINESFHCSCRKPFRRTGPDYAEAISRFNLQLTALQAAQQATRQNAGPVAVQLHVMYRRGLCDRAGKASFPRSITPLLLLFPINHSFAFKT